MRQQQQQQNEQKKQKKEEHLWLCFWSGKKENYSLLSIIFFSPLLKTENNLYIIKFEGKTIETRTHIHNDYG